jgi:23S rRNA (guanosine2251-2'-O)-methyltransferase
VPIAREALLTATLAHLAELDPTLVALEPSQGADLYNTELDGTLLLALGSEGAGLDSQLSARAEIRITIPVAPPVESLNATVAASVVLLELARRRRASARK